MKGKRSVICSLGALGVLLALLVVAAQWDTATAATYNPTSAVTVSDDTAGANADVTSSFNVPAGDANYDLNISFSPAEFVRGTDIPIGAHVANLDALATLGLLNNVCETALPVSFEMHYATTDTTDTVIFEDSYVDFDGNTLADGVEKYPDFLNTIFPGVTPVARFFGTTSAAGTAVTMNQVFFAPGSTLYGVAFDAGLGNASVQVLNNPVAELAPNPITDFCTPLSADVTTFGISKDNAATAEDESGYAVIANPTAGGDYTFTTYTTSLLDADDDGPENGLDTCPFDVNSGEDDDNDGIDNVCDPDPAVASPGLDEDGDGYMNRGDNCPMADNYDQADGDADGIGDACDTNPATADGVATEMTLTSTVTIVGEAVPPEETPTPAVVEETPTPAVVEETPTPAVTPTPAATPAPTPTPIPPEVGGVGLLGSDDGGFPVWAVYVIVVAAALMLGGIGTMATVVWRRRQ